MVSVQVRDLVINNLQLIWSFSLTQSCFSSDGEFERVFQLSQAVRPCEDHTVGIAEIQVTGVVEMITELLYRLALRRVLFKGLGPCKICGSC